MPDTLNRSAEGTLLSSTVTQRCYPRWSHNIHLNLLGSFIATFSIPSVACTVSFIDYGEACQRLCLLSQAKRHLPQQRRRAL